MSDEEYEDPNSQKEDMKTYLNNLAERIDNLVKSLMDAKEFVGTQTSERIIRQQLEAREGLRDKDGKQVNIAEYFNNLVQQEQWKLLRCANLEFKYKNDCRYYFSLNIFRTRSILVIIL